MSVPSIISVIAALVLTLPAAPSTVAPSTVTPNGATLCLIFPFLPPCKHI